MTKATKNIIKTLVSLLLAGWLIFSVNWKEVLVYLIDVKISYLFLFVMLYLAGLAISSYKWKILASFKDFDYPFSFFFRNYFLGVFLNNFFPSFVGGDTYRSIALGRKGSRFHASAGTVVFDRVSGLLAAIFLGLIFGLLNLSTLRNFVMWRYFIIATLIGMIVCLALVIFLPKKLFKKWLEYAPEIVAKHIKELMAFRDLKIFSEAIIWASIFAFVGLVAVNYVLFLAVGIKIDLIDYLSVIFFISIASAAPVSVGNIGVKEWAYIVFFGIFGVSSGVAVSVVLLSRVIQLLVSLFALPMYLKDSKLQHMKNSLLNE